MPLLLTLALGIALFTTAFAIQNSDVITVTFLAWRWEASLALILLAAFALGALAGLISCFAALVRGRMSEAALGRRVRELEARETAEAAKAPSPRTPEDAPPGPAA